MRSLERRFKNIQRKNPYTGDCVCFARAVKKQKFNKTTIAYWFNRIIKKDDYSKSDKKDLIKHLENL